MKSNLKYFYLCQILALINSIIFTQLKPAGDYANLLIASFAFFMLMAALSVRFAPRGLSGFTLVCVLINSLAIRIIITQFEISDDVYRYTWEGHIQNNGYNPYQFAPQAPNLRHLIWDGYQKPNHSDLTTIYSPLALQFFRLVALVTLDYEIYSYLFVFLDMLVICLILGLLRWRGDPLEHLIWYALNPVCIVAFAGQGHLDIIMVFWLVLSLINHHRKAWTWMWICLALAVLSKFPAIFLIFCFLNRSNWSRSIIFLIVLIGGYVPYANAEVQLFETLWVFGTSYQYNNSLFGIVYGLCGHQLLTLGFLIGLALIGCGWVLLISENPLISGVFVGTCFLLFSPTVHYWYLSLILPFVCFYRKSYLLMWCATSGVWLIVLQSMQEARFDHYPYYQLIQYLPVYFLIFKDFTQSISKNFNVTSIKILPKLSVIVPVLNEEHNLQILIKQIKLQLKEGDEFIVVDGGSHDNSQQVVLQNGVELINSQKGRGYQITKGIQSSVNPVVLILHADQTISEQVLDKVRWIMSFKEYRGGCIGSTFENLRHGQWIIQSLNVFRARVMGISFGDQGQFFRRSCYEAESWNLNMPLMEDVELALRLLNSSEPICYLNGGLCTSVRRWQNNSRLMNALQIILLVLKYVTARRLKGWADTSELYRRYYRG